jgi:hypothetical protein
MMSKYTFIHETDTTKVVHTIDSVTWPELLENFKYFLAGCGFMLPDGDITILSESEEN